MDREGRARIRLAHYTPTEARVRIRERSGWARILRALLAAVAVPPAALVAFLIPPHGETLFAAVGIGIYLVYREASTRFVVGEFAGTCPRCGSTISLKPGTRLTGARSVPCYGCHFHVTIELPRPDAEAAAIVPA